MPLQHEDVCVPIYEYYCAVCQGRFSHLARRIGEAPPACPRCGNQQVEKLIAAAHVVQGEAHHRSVLKEDAAAVDREDPQAMAEFLKSSGRLEDTSGLYGSRAYHELIERRIDGATDADLVDLVDDLSRAAEGAEATDLAAAVVLSKQVDNRIGAVGPPADHDATGGHAQLDSGAAPEVDAAGGTSSDQPRAHSRRSSRHLGWG